MKITVVKTEKIIPFKQTLEGVLDKYIISLEENSVVAVTSKIVAICEGRVVRMDGVDKEELIRSEASLYLPKASSKFNVSLTVTNNLLVPSAGIDESNGNGYYILWPKNPQKTANKIRSYLKKRFSLKNIGVIITDSRTTPLRWGVTGMAIAHSGFSPLKDYTNTKDLFGRLFVYEKLNIADSLATASTLAMGEGAEQTPISIIEDIPFVNFNDRDLSQKELKELKIDIEDDLYAPLLKSVKWIKGKG